MSRNALAILLPTTQSSKELRVSFNSFIHSSQMLSIPQFPGFCLLYFLQIHPFLYIDITTILILALIFSYVSCCKAAKLVSPTLFCLPARPSTLQSESSIYKLNRTPLTFVTLHLITDIDRVKSKLLSIAYKVPYG
jgi:hypothetical protein